jgi:hypothetical protein
MPRHEWKQSDQEVVKVVCGWRQQNAGGLVRWARESVETLHYYADLALQESEIARNHESHIVEVAHLRSACGAAITALDLCGAALARRFALRDDELTGHEFDLEDFNPSGATKNAKKTEREGHVSALREGPRRWVAETLADPSYTKLKSFRNPLTHGRTLRHWHQGGNNDRVEFGPIDKSFAPETSKSLVIGARDFATRRVESFSLLVVAGDL